MVQLIGLAVAEHPGGSPQLSQKERLACGDSARGKWDFLLE